MVLFVEGHGCHRVAERNDARRRERCSVEHLDLCAATASTERNPVETVADRDVKDRLTEAGCDGRADYRRPGCIENSDGCPITIRHGDSRWRPTHSEGRRKLHVLGELERVTFEEAHAVEVDAG